MVKSLTVNENYNGNTSNLKMTGNLNMDGSNSSAINN